MVLLLKKLRAQRKKVQNKLYDNKQINMVKKQPVISNAQKLGIGVGLTTAAVAAAGAYFLYGSKGAAKNRKVVKSWAIKAKGEVLEAIEKAEKITEDEFNNLVRTVVSTYSNAQKISRNDLSDFKNEMSDNWKGLAKMGISKITKAKKVASPAKKVAKKAATVTKKVAPKAAAKVPAKKAVS